MNSAMRRNGSSFLDIDQHVFQAPASGLEHIDSVVANVGDHEAKAGNRDVEID